MSAHRPRDFHVGSPTRFTRFAHPEDLPNTLLLDVDANLDVHLLAPHTTMRTGDASLVTPPQSAIRSDNGSGVLTTFLVLEIRRVNSSV